MSLFGCGLTAPNMGPRIACFLAKRLSSEESEGLQVFMVRREAFRFEDHWCAIPGTMGQDAKGRRTLSSGRQDLQPLHNLRADNPIGIRLDIECAQPKCDTVIRRLSPELALTQFCTAGTHQMITT